MVNYKIKINYQDTKILSSDIQLVSGDVGAYRFCFSFYDNGEPVDISNYVLTVRAKRADGEIIEGSGEIKDGVAYFVPKNSMYAVAGELYMEVALTTKEKSYITTKVIIATVIQGLGKDVVVESDDVSVYVTLLGQIQTQISQVRLLIENAQEAAKEAKAAQESANASATAAALSNEEAAKSAETAKNSENAAKSFANATTYDRIVSQSAAQESQTAAQEAKDVAESIGMLNDELEMTLEDMA